jgi:hypothetical protein
MFVRVEPHPLGKRLHIGHIRLHHAHAGLALIAFGVRLAWRDRRDFPWR